MGTYNDMHIYQLMGVFCERLTFGSTAALDFLTGQDKSRYRDSSNRTVFGTNHLNRKPSYWRNLYGIKLQIRKELSTVLNQIHCI